eukprot:7361843-Prymnesium_polylepis.1
MAGEGVAEVSAEKGSLVVKVPTLVTYTCTPLKGYEVHPTKNGRDFGWAVRAQPPCPRGKGLHKLWPK